MKNLLFTIFMSAPVLAYAQDQKCLPDKNEPIAYSCHELEATSDNKIMLLKKDVHVVTENLTLRADSALISYDNKTWIAYGTKELTFNDKFVASVMSGNSIQYRMGEKTIYIWKNGKELVFFY